MNDGGRPVDVAVVGGGIVGCACAWRAAAAGLRVVLLEAGRLGGAATGAGMGHLVVIDEDPAELALSRLSMDEWRRWPAWPQVEHKATGTLWIAETEAQQQAALAKRDRLNAAGWPSEWIDSAQLRAAEPQLAHDLPGALRVGGDEVAYGPGLALQLAAELRALGGQVEEGARVVAIDAQGVRLADGRALHCGQVLLAAGCATPALAGALGVPASAWPIVPRKGQLAITDRYPGYLRHALVELGYVDSAHGSAPESVAFNAQPRASGQVLLGSSRQYGVTDPSIDAALLGRMVRRAQRFLPTLGDLQLLRCWAGFRPATPDGRPLIGAIAPGRWIAAGHEGLGLTTALGTARLWIDQLLGAPPAIDLAPFDPARFGAVAA